VLSARLDGHEVPDAFLKRVVATADPAGRAARAERGVDGGRRALLDELARSWARRSGRRRSRPSGSAGSCAAGRGWPRRSY